MPQEQKPVQWAHYGRLSQLLTWLLPLRRPPVLVLSFPRSGSSWVGETLGSAADALYLREPITQSQMVAGRRQTVIAVDPTNPPAETAHLAETAFAGLPAFSAAIVKEPTRWQLRHRPGRRLVIKEVNPLACAFLVQRFRPKVIFLVRHPAAVVLSYRQRGWWTADTFTWETMGAQQGAALRAAWDTLKGYSDCRVVEYETLCLEPVEQFQALFDFAGLAWDEAIQAAIVKRSTGGDRQDPYGTARNSREMADAWRADFPADGLPQLRAGFAAYGLPWYQAESDWQPDPTYARTSN